MSEHARVLGVPLLRADEIRMLRPPQAILLSDYEPPALLSMPPYFRQPELQAQSELAPLPFPSASGGEVAYLPMDAGAALSGMEASLRALFADVPSDWAAGPTNPPKPEPSANPNQNSTARPGPHPYRTGLPKQAFGEISREADQDVIAEAHGNHV